MSPAESLMTVRTAEPKHQLQRSWWRQHAVKASVKLTRHACIHTRLLSSHVKRPLTSTELHFLCSLPPESQNGNTKLTTTFIQLNYPHPACQCRPPSFLTDGFSSLVLTFPFRSPQNFMICFNRQHKKRAEVSCNLPQMQNILESWRKGLCVTWVGVLMHHDTISGGKHHPYMCLALQTHVLSLV